jgi:hypothetical protein
MTRPAEEPGTPLEPPRERRPRWMVTLDRIRLTGLLRKTPASAGVFYRAKSEPAAFAASSYALTVRALTIRESW